MESINRQKSRELWLKERDRNTKFFHLSIVIRRKRNRINAIQDGDKWLFKENDIAAYFKDNFEKLFTSDHPSFNSEIEELINPCITEEDNNALTRIPLEEEIKKSIWSLHPLKSPGPNGFPGIFYRKCWDIVKGKVVNFVQECFRLGVIPSRVNRTFIVLIPKSNQALGFN